jgi:probable phosphoglycerate mutase
LPTTRFCMIRHGETAWNAERRMQGQIDVPLNANGHRQAQAMAEAVAHESFAAIYSSSLSRARETAEAAAQRLHLPVLLRAELRERNYGIFQTNTATALAEKHPEAYVKHVTRDPDYDYEGGESLRLFANRVEAGLKALAAQHPDQQLLVVTHGGVLDIVYRLATGRGLSTPRDFSIPNAALNWLDHVDGEWRMELWGDTEHLQRLAALDELK